MKLAMKYAVLAGLVLVAPAFAPVAVAQQPGMIIAYLDKNADGKCDLNEYLAFQVTRIAEVDKDGDGELQHGRVQGLASGQGEDECSGSVQGREQRGWTHAQPTGIPWLPSVGVQDIRRQRQGRFHVARGMVVNHEPRWLNQNARRETFSSGDLRFQSRSAKTNGSVLSSWCSNKGGAACLLQYD